MQRCDGHRARPDGKRPASARGTHRFGSGGAAAYLDLLEPSQYLSVGVLAANWRAASKEALADTDDLLLNFVVELAPRSVFKQLLHHVLRLETQAAQLFNPSLEHRVDVLCRLDQLMVVELRRVRVLHGRHRRLQLDFAIGVNQQPNRRRATCTVQSQVIAWHDKGIN